MSYLFNSYVIKKLSDSFCSYNEQKSASDALMTAREHRSKTSSSGKWAIPIHIHHQGWALLWQPWTWLVADLQMITTNNLYPDYQRIIRSGLRSGICIYTPHKTSWSNIFISYFQDLLPSSKGRKNTEISSATSRSSSAAAVGTVHLLLTVAMC